MILKQIKIKTPWGKIAWMGNCTQTAYRQQKFSLVDLFCGQKKSFNFAQTKNLNKKTSKESFWNLSEEFAGFHFPLSLTFCGAKGPQGERKGDCVFFSLNMAKQTWQGVVGYTATKGVKGFIRLNGKAIFFFTSHSKQNQ